MSSITEPGVSHGAIPFAGREEELATLLQAYRNSYNGARTVTLVTGEMGTGKSRLLDEFCRTPEVAQQFVIRLRRHRGDGTRSLDLLMRALLDALDGRPQLRRNIESTFSLFLETDEASFRLGRILDALVRRVPVVIVVDDFDAGGSAFTAELGGLMRLVKGAFMIVATASPGREDLLRDCARHADADFSSITLGPLSRETIARYIELLFAIEVGREDVNWLLDATRGLPILLREATYVLLRSGCIAMHDRRWRRVHPFKNCHFSAIDVLPTLSARLAELPEADRDILAAAALLGRIVPFEVMESIGHAKGWHESFVDRDILVVKGSAIAFAHELVFEVALVHAERSGRYVGMRELVVDLLQRYAESEEPLSIPSSTLRMILHAATREERAPLLDAMLGAAQRMREGHRYTIAVGYFNECRRWWVELRDRHPVTTLARWTSGHADTLYKLGQVPDQMKILHEFLADFDNVAPSQELAPIVARMLLRIVEMFSREKKLDDAMALLERSETIALLCDEEQQQELRDEIDNHRAEALRAADRNAEAFAILTELLNRHDPSIFSPRAFDALIFLARTAHDEEYWEWIMERVRVMLDLCEREGHPRPALQLRCCILQDLWAKQDMEAFTPAARDLLHELQEAPLPRTESNIWYWFAIDASRQGDYVEALANIDKTIDIRWNVKSIAMWQYAMIVKGVILVSAARNEEALAIFQSVEDDALQNGRAFHRFLITTYRAIVAVRRGEWTEGDRGVARIAEIGVAEEYHNVDWVIARLQGEILLNTPEPSLTRAESFAETTRELNIDDPDDQFLIVTAASVIGRAVSNSRSAGRRRRRDATITEVTHRTLEVLRRWQERQAHFNIATYVRQLRLHAPHLFDEGELDPFVMEKRMPATLLLEITESEVLSFGRLRVVDRAGEERGGRHFGTQKSDSKPRKVLAALVVAAVQGRRIARERLIDMVWGESTSDESAANNFHVTLSGLRQVMGDGIDFDGTTYALNLQLLRVDTVEFHKLLDQARGADQAGMGYRAYDLLKQACGLYTGEFLEGIYDEWSDGPREDLRVQVRSAYLRLAELAIARGEHNVARSSVQALFAIDQTDEEAMLLSLWILHAEGERPRAIREYNEFAQLLRGEYGVDPSRRLREFRDVIAGD